MKEGAPKQHCGTERRQAVSGFVIHMVYPQHFINESRFEPAGYREPDNSLRNEFCIPRRWKREFLQYVSSVETPLLTLYVVFEEQLDRV
jgi:hypothetical protein